LALDDEGLFLKNYLLLKSSGGLMHITAKKT